MELNDIRQYSHKIKKIYVKNQNTVSQHNSVIIKINIDDKKDDEIIRFSMNEDSEWLNHQSSDNDYFLEIPNKMNETITLYAHYFPVALYDYLEEEQIFSIYDWSELAPNASISHYHTQQYSINNNAALINDSTFFKDNIIYTNATSYLINGNIPYIENNNEQIVFMDGQLFIFTPPNTTPVTYNLADGEQITVSNNVYTRINYYLYVNGTPNPMSNNMVTVNQVSYVLKNNTLYTEGTPYNATINQKDYNYMLDDDDKLVVRSLLNNSINGFKDPNYKNYTKLINDDNISNATEKGYFPLSSRYRGYKYINAPNINQNPLPYWSNTDESFVDCTRDNDSPYWQAKIHKNGLSPLIGEKQDGEYLPINVYLNYQYLPSSTEYHQHYYGFEPRNPENGGMYNNAPNNTFTILDGENLNTINKQFGKNSTYRIINKGNPFDDTEIHTMTIEHDKVIPIDLENGIPTRDSNDDYTCIWEKNTCPNEGYWIYRPNGQGHVSINVELQEDQPYKLQYYMYIPSESIVEDDSCTVTVEHIDDNGNVTTIDELNQDMKNILLKQDKILRDQWIYHEIDFRAEENNRICIKGPQHKKSDLTINTVNGETYTKEQHETINDDEVYFINFRLIKMGEYSPTIKYNSTGVFLAEQDKWAFKSISEQSTDCVSTIKDAEHIPLWENKSNLPTPIKDVYFIFENDFDILYDAITSELSWTAGIKDCVFKFSNYNEYEGNGELEWQTDDTEISLIFDKLTTINGKAYHSSEENGQIGEMKLYRRQKKVFTTGANNAFTLILQDSNGNRVNSGKVECAIVKTIAEKNLNQQKHTPCDETVMCLGEMEPDEYGRVTYSHLNFKNLKPSDEEITYFLRITYTRPCYDRKIVDFKALIFEREHRNINAFINYSDNHICTDKPKISEANTYIRNNATNLCKLCAISEYSKDNYKYMLYQSPNDNRTITHVTQLPLRIDVNIYNQLGVALNSEGYCELSINDRLVQSTIVDDNGIADFYIDYEDIYDTEYENHNDITKHTIKIEYFNKYYESINYLYFDILYDFAHGYDSRPAIPIKLYSISTDSLMLLNGQEYNMKNKDEIFMLNIDTEKNSGFSIGVILNGVEISRKNIYDSTDTFIITGTYNGQPKDTYTIYTDNIIGREQTGDYRKNQRSFVVVW